MTTAERAVAEMLSAYNQALNSSDTNAVMLLYAQDGVFMPPHRPSASVRSKCAKRTTRCSLPFD